jgi:hypothetical protein
MTRRDWVLVASAGLCAGLAPACSHTVRQTATAVEQAEVEQPVQTARAGSPYHPLLSKREDQAPDPALARTDYAAPLTGPDLPPQPRPAQELTASSADRRRPVEPPVSAGEEEGAVSPASFPEGQPATEAPLVAALRCCLSNRPAEAMSWLERYDKRSQDLLLCLLPLAARLAEVDLPHASPQEVAAILAQLHSAMAPLRLRAALSISKMALCRHIEKFGSYEPFPSHYAFRPNEPVHLYAELQNFSSEAQGPFYLTRLSGRVEIRDVHGALAHRLDIREGDQVDLSRTLRQDFFIHCSFRIPPLLPPGAYTLWIQVTDTPTQRTAERGLDLYVAPGGSGAVRVGRTRTSPTIPTTGLLDSTG